MSRFSIECICIGCAEEEKKDPEYEKAVKAELEEIKRGNFNYKGIRGGK
jgi:hypothetical protein